MSTYKVKRGDTLSKIAKENGMSLNELLEINNISRDKADRINIGQEIKLKSTEDYNGTNWNFWNENAPQNVNTPLKADDRPVLLAKPPVWNTEYASKKDIVAPTLDQERKPELIKRNNPKLEKVEASENNQYDYVLNSYVPRSSLKTVLNGVVDAYNHEKYKLKAKKAREENAENPEINMNWVVTPYQLSRLIDVLPTELTPTSNTNYTSLSTEGFDSNDFKQSTDFTQWIGSKGRIGGLIQKSIESPGRGTLGRVNYMTTPEGIVISDGYKWTNDGNQKMSNIEGYDETVSKMKSEYAADNKTSQKYFIPWEVYHSTKK